MDQKEEALLFITVAIVLADLSVDFVRIGIFSKGKFDLLSLGKHAINCLNQNLNQKYFDLKPSVTTIQPPHLDICIQVTQRLCKLTTTY